jgi:hypothetical protein
LDEKECILTRPKLSREFFGTLANGDSVEAITFVNANGMRVRIIGYGAVIQSVYVPDAQGRFADVTTGYDTLDAYVAQPHYFGSTIGRVANRIAGARFTLGGKEYLVPANDGATLCMAANWGLTRSTGPSHPAMKRRCPSRFRISVPMATKAIPGTYP